MTSWTKTVNSLPPEGYRVETKLDDADGVRNKQVLIRKGNLWFVEDESIYVYYNPTHWRHTLPGK